MLAFILASAESEALPDARACFAGSTGAVLPVLWGRVAATRTTRKREPDSSGTLRPPVRIACVPCSAFFTGRPLSCAPSCEGAARLQRAGPVPRYPRRLLSWCCSLLFRGRLCRAAHLIRCGPDRRGLAGCAALHVESLVATMLVLLAAAGLLRSRCGVSCCVG